ncbi:MAG: hypothetical protein J7604_15695 [Sporocytophaga sp.]|uniref:hypothetical protein n=1 Tax=Sporocytophaga sp. TaxID=2231183 RepID=UPI001B230E85|nr:hypothetical protein [Sporocytophaga sp.]MBO9701649.1 hypothetical protein [Sporocytophaga sp.]
MLEIKDLLLTPIYLFVIYILALIYRAKYVKDKEDRKYFLPALIVKIIGAVCLGLIYNYYYKGGDTFNYFYHINYIHNLFYSDPLSALKLLTIDNSSPNYDLLIHTSNLYFTQDPSSYFLIRLGVLISLISFGTYTIIAIFFALISFLSAWKLYLALNRLYPDHQKEIAISIFFIPSVAFWGSGLMKDSLTLAALSLGFCYFLKYFILKERKILYLFIILLMLYVLKSVKIYIAMCLIPSILIYLFVYLNSKIKSKSLRFFVKPIFLIIGCVLAYFAITKVSETDSRYSLTNFLQTAKVTSGWISYVSLKEGGSYYSLGEYDATLSGLLMKFPQAVWVSLFRPYPWESKNIVMILSSLESFFFLIFTFYVLFRQSPVKFYQKTSNDPYLQFAFLFSITFAFAVGVSTYNFGSLMRYKIPMMSFYLSFLFIINKSYNASEIKKIKKKKRLPFLRSNKI